MGFYLPSRPSAGPRDDCSPSITAGEYVALFRGVVNASVNGLSRGLLARQLAVLHLGGGPEAAARVLNNYLSRHPTSAIGRRCLGVAYLRAGHLRAAVKQLEIALDLLTRAGATPLSLRESLWLRLESARIRLVLRLLYAKLGMRDALLRLGADAGPL